MKKDALDAFWTQHFHASTLKELIPSPVGRGYRMVTKRKAFNLRGEITIGLIDPSQRRDGGCMPVGRCAIEPEIHGRIFASIQHLLNRPLNRGFASHLMHVVIKANDTEQTVIFSLDAMNGPIIQSANAISRAVTRDHPSVVGTFVYLDPSDGSHYLGMRKVGPKPTIRKLFGKSDVFTRICGRPFLHNPLTFSQVNPSVLDAMIERAGAMLSTTPDAALFDLYSGYGPFTLCLSNRVSRVTGVEVSAASISSAIDNARRQKQSNVHFVRSDITADTVHRVMSRASTRDLAILDPPRGGVNEGVLESIAAHRPARVLHIFCNIELIPHDAAVWARNGYALQSAVPVDMFPGTDDVEMMVLFERQASG